MIKYITIPRERNRGGDFILTSPIPNIPAHLKRYVVNQNYDKYTPINQAVWRYVMRQNHNFLKDSAHSSYIDGLRDSGIKMESIPMIEEMNTCLQPFGWGAVTIDGFIPGVVFFDFQAHGILPIAADIRQLEHIEYTPAPDIIHEAAGHAPILCNPQYANYVKIFGEIGRKAIATKEEHEVFEAIRTLSALLESGTASEQDIQKAKDHLDEKKSAVTGVSEAEQISRLYWWTVEYGLIGELDQPCIYGAGLLSSVGESAYSLTNQVQKIPFDLETVIQTGFDITKMQPQLFVCQSFDQLIAAVQEFSKKMAFCVGGTESLFKAMKSTNMAYVTYSSGLQVSGKVARILCDDQGKAICFQTAGFTALSFECKQLYGHNKEAYPHGILAPIGPLKGMIDSIEHFTEDDLKAWNIVPNQTCHLKFDSGLLVHGIVKSIFRKNEKIILISFYQAEVSYQGEVLLGVDSGSYNMVVGESIISVAAGVADPESFFFESISESVQPQPSITTPKVWSRLEKLYAEVRSIRENNGTGKDQDNMLQKVIDQLNSDFPNDWLLRLEILEWLSGRMDKWKSLSEQLLLQLENLKQENPDICRLITNGLKLIKK